MIIEMARRLNMLVVAEGAETHEQVQYLREKRCQQVQGFYYSPAIPLQQIPRFVEEQRFKRQQPMFS
jgi:sensor c-di-GMP phosphodiesterase-like protein